MRSSFLSIPNPLTAVGVCIVALVVLAVLAVAIAALLVFALLALPGYIGIRGGFMIGDLIDDLASRYEE